jgi:hypothetical protein
MQIVPMVILMDAVHKVAILDFLLDDLAEDK